MGMMELECQHHHPMPDVPVSHKQQVLCNGAKTVWVNQITVKQERSGKHQANNCP